MILSMEKNGAVDEEPGEDDEDEQVDGDIGAEVEAEVDGDDEYVDANRVDDGEIGGRMDVLGLGLPCLQGRLRNLVSTTASP